ncbi:hypothetical protein [Aquicoccus sp. SU-CL01552]|uniref:DUF6932 family protein n=1 Tax=Aquicoccus sp. SU-CL01552 TaxID=3127656 RepID=UPI00333EE8F1
MAGILPPVRPGTNPAGPDRSPYTVSLHDLVNRFATSPERAAILEGLIDYRADLYKIGIVDGFQWVNGSFLEDIETNESRPPNDIDVVTYIVIPSGYSQASLLPALAPLMDKKATKAKYKVDAHVFDLKQVTIPNVCYWYSLWSHRRDGLWKGFAHLPLDPAKDSTAQTALVRMTASGFGS